MKEFSADAALNVAETLRPAVAPEQSAGLPVETEALELEDATLGQRVHVSPARPWTFRNLSEFTTFYSGLIARFC